MTNQPVINEPADRPDKIHILQALRNKPCASQSVDSQISIVTTMMPSQHIHTSEKRLMRGKYEHQPSAGLEQHCSISKCRLIILNMLKHIA